MEMYNQTTNNLQMGRSFFCLFERHIGKQTNVSNNERLVSTKISMFGLLSCSVLKNVPEAEFLNVKSPGIDSKESIPRT